VNGQSFRVSIYGSITNYYNFEVVSSDWDPLRGTNITYLNTTLQDANGNLFFEPIPFEMLRTYEEEPQVMITIDGNPVACHSMACNFKYVEPECNITAFSFDEDTNILIVEGDNLPTGEQITWVNFADSLCIVDEDTQTNETFTCTLERDPAHGEWAPILLSDMGKVPVDPAAPLIIISATLTSVTINTGLNTQGGDTLTFVGTKLPHDLLVSTHHITFNDVDVTSCIPLTSTSTEFTCLTARFGRDPSTSLGLTLDIEVMINDLIVPNSLTVTMSPTPSPYVLMWPESISPVLKQDIEFELGGDYTLASLNKDHFTVRLINTEAPDYYKDLKVNEVDEDLNTFTCKFGGAWSGDYTVEIRHVELGMLDTSFLLLAVESDYTSIVPRSGSIYGGTLLTI